MPKQQQQEYQKQNQQDSPEEYPRKHRPLTIFSPDHLLIPLYWAKTPLLNTESLEQRNILDIVGFSKNISPIEQHRSIWPSTHGLIILWDLCYLFTDPRRQCKSHGPMPATTTIFFNLQSHHHLVSTHPHSPHQSRPSKWLPPTGDCPHKASHPHHIPCSPQCATWEHKTPQLVHPVTCTYHATGHSPH